MQITCYNKIFSIFSFGSFFMSSMNFIAISYFGLIYWTNVTLLLKVFILVSSWPSYFDGKSVITCFKRIFRAVSSSSSRGFHFFCRRNPSQVLILPTLYAHLFCTKEFCAAFLYLQLMFVIFWPKENGKKTACKMLVKLTTGRVTMAMTTLLTLAAMFGAVRYVVYAS